MEALDADTEFWDTILLVFIPLIMSYLNVKFFFNKLHIYRHAYFIMRNLEQLRN